MEKIIDINNPAPLYKQVEDNIRDKIVKGILKPGDKINSHHELVKEFSVSLITVKKAISNLVNENVLFTRIGMGTYVAEKKANYNNLKDHKTIGLVLRDLNHPFFSLIVRSIEQKAYELGYTLLLSSSSNNIEKEEAQINHFRKLGVDGLIIASLSLEYRATSYIQKLHEENFPYIMVSYMHDPDYWYIGSDHELGGYLATEHLIKLGYKTIGYVHVGTGNLLSEVRKNGYYRALADNQIQFNSERIFYLSNEPFDTGADRFTRGYNFGKHFSSLEDRPQALVIYSDSVALGFLKACTENKVIVPDDVGIVGFDDIEVSKHASTPLTTIRQEHDWIGAGAVEIIQKRIDGIDIGNRNIIKPSLVIRKSCGAELIKNSIATSDTVSDAS